MRSVRAALLGFPNSGKSTLLNKMAGRKISIATHKAQTTRAPILGVLEHDGRRVIVSDTPGINSRAGKYASSAERAVGMGLDADALLVVIDAARKNAPADKPLEEALRAASLPVLIVLNKIDLVPRQSLLAMAARWSSCVMGSGGALFMLSAKTGDGVGDLLAHLSALKSRGASLAMEEEMPREALAAEITREKLYLRLHDEIPYQTVVETDLWEERPDGSLALKQTIRLRRESHKILAIGKGGRTLRAIGEAARAEMRELFARPVHLNLTVRVRKKRGANTPHGMAR